MFLGIGINVEKAPVLKQDLIVPKAGCLWDFVKEEHDCQQNLVLQALLEKIAINYNILLRNGFPQLLNAYRDYSLVLGKNVRVYSDPFDGDPEFVVEGKVIRIGENLELYLENVSDPVTKGRILISR